MINFIRSKLTVVFLLFSSSLVAQSWNFSPPINVTESAKAGVFHHLESSGRRNIAVSGNIVGITWEDDSDGIPRIYLARKNLDSNHFDTKVRISGEGEAYEPTIISLGGGLFAIGWEEDEQVSLRIVTPEKMGPILKIGNKTASQASLANFDDSILVVYREQVQRFGKIILQELNISDENQLSPVKRCAVDSELLENDQLYPVIAVLQGQVNVAWEDRRFGHTVIMHSQASPNDSCQFTPPVRISEKPKGSGSPYGAGHGVARVTLASYGSSWLYAVWADKRDYREGYDIFGAAKNGDNLFGPNKRVQDDFGNNARQWHATLAGHKNGQLVAAWTDERDGSMDIWYSQLEEGEWSSDTVVPAVSREGIQYHPSITLDQSGNLHLAWIYRQTGDGPTQVRYVQAQPKND
ncbi:MAG: hypothetical protein P8Y20_03325 [Gammaproteobacteria bacterium]